MQRRRSQSCSAKKPLHVVLRFKNQHYPLGKVATRGVRIATRQIFSNWYAAEGIAKDSDVEEYCLRGDKRYLHM